VAGRIKEPSPLLGEPLESTRIDFVFVDFEQVSAATGRDEVTR
jgi:hypothetical protein